MEGGESGGVRIAALAEADAGACSRLEAVLFPGDDPWPAGAFVAEIRAGHRYLAAWDDARTRSGAEPGGARLVGYAGIALLPGRPPEAEVHTIGVDPAHQGRGTGRVLLRGLLEAADGIAATVYLEVRTDNAPALALYRSEGFEVVGTRRRYYASGADAYTMARPPRSGDHPR